MAALACLSLAASESALAAQEVTFSRDVAPIFYERCVLCHRPNDVAPMSLLTWADARPWARSVAREVASRQMPPFHAAPGDYPFANDTSLSQAEIDLIVDWVEQGALEGDPEALPPTPDFEALSARHRLGEPDLVLEAERSFTLAPGSDLQRAFVLKNPLDEDVWLSAIDYDSRSPVVHHLLAVTDPTGRAREFEREDDLSGFAVSLVSGEGTDRLMQLYMRGASFLGSWAPGWVAREFGDDIGIRLRRGHDVVLQIHYWNGSEETVEHRPQVGLYLHPGEVRRVLRSGGPAADPHIFIAAGDANAEHEDEWTVPGDLHVLSASPHMHFLGKSMKVTALFPDGSNRVLLDVPRFRFEWQATYAFEEPVFLPRGTRVRMVSVHDNSATNPDNPSSPPRDVTFGERSVDEMAECILAYTLVDDDVSESETSELDRLDEYLETLRAQPNDARLRYHVARILLAQRRDEEALEHLQAAVRLVPDFLPARRALAGVLERTERLSEAVRELEQIVVARPSAGGAHLDLARVQESRGLRKEALEHYVEALDSSDLGGEDRAEAHFRVGTLRFDEGAFDEATQHFRQAAELVPTMTEAHLNLAILSARSRRFDVAVERYGRVIELEPTNLQARFSQAVALLLSGDESAALEVLEQGRAIEPENVELSHLLARILAAASEDSVRDGERALVLAQRVFAARRQAEPAETLAMALAEVGRFSEAVELQRQVVQGLQDSAAAETVLAAARRRLVGYERAEPCRSPWLE